MKKMKILVLPVAAALAAAARGEAIVEIIADGVHVAPEMVAMVFDLIGAERIALISDAMTGTGLGDGSYRLGSLDVDVSDGVARLLGGGSIAGSTSTLAQCTAWAREVAGVPAEEVEHAAKATPAVVLTGRVGRGAAATMIESLV